MKEVVGVVRPIQRLEPISKDVSIFGSGLLVAQSQVVRPQWYEVVLGKKDPIIRLVTYCLAAASEYFGIALAFSPELTNPKSLVIDVNLIVPTDSFKLTQRAAVRNQDACNF